MEIAKKHIESQNEIGTCDGMPVISIRTYGGFNIIALQRRDSLEVLATGPNKALAKHGAKKKKPNMVITELAKSDESIDGLVLDPELIAFYDNLTRMLNE